VGFAITGALIVTAHARTSLAVSAGRGANLEAPAVELLRELVALQRQILAAIERQHRPISGLSRDDARLLAKLLPAAGGVFGSEPFLARDLFDSEAAAVKLVTRGLNVRQVGRLFRRGEGQAIDGYAIQRDGEELNAIQS
jgi:hypothetical protein